ncbi:hypothetical protein TELCIR_21867 [Teladorsagia circumcincta]|uniref:Uncharacterized protein n=1 Tax=Teladorsagia circumcincta TaxID=45464 RepID=A0A2G9TGT2_TELCI|nr:hypothetical protein TELCIR_21867 [Teladorsagia circumcincta]
MRWILGVTSRSPVQARTNSDGAVRERLLSRVFCCGWSLCAVIYGR